MFCFLFSSRVYEIRDASQYNKKDYFLYYEDADEECHLVVPFTNYIYNDSYRIVKVTPIYYGFHQEKSLQENNPEIYNSKVFRRIINQPDYIFQTPPQIIRIKGHSRGTTRYLLNYE